jgi:uracil-DNA glycosylase
MLPPLPESWHRVAGEGWNAPAFDPLRAFVAGEYTSQTVYPPAAQVFSALELTPPGEVKAVILGQDPYHGERQAHGLAFSVQPGVRPPASLGNIFKELQEDVGIVAPKGVGDLTAWARQGVLLLNTILTVRQATPLSHKGRGWEAFTDSILRQINAGDERVVFVLWGGHAQKKRDLIDTSKHVVIESAHPSPLSARTGFFGSKPFSRINQALEGFGKGAVDWRL